MCGNGHFVGYFFYENNLTGDSYPNLMTETIIPELRQMYRSRFNRPWWIQDGAQAHRYRAVRKMLNHIFNNRIIAISGLNTFRHFPVGTSQE